MPSPNRITIPLPADSIDRLRVVSAANNLSHAKVIACLLSLPDEDIKEICEKNVARLFVKKSDLNEKRKLAKKALASLSNDDIEKILTMAKQDV